MQHIHGIVFSVSVQWMFRDKYNCHKESCTVINKEQEKSSQEIFILLNDAAPVKFNSSAQNERYLHTKERSSTSD